MQMRQWILCSIASSAVAFGVFVVALSGLFYLDPAGEARAQAASSSNFRTEDGTINDFGGSATSSGFQLLNAGGQNIIGDSTSTNFIMHAGPLNFDAFYPASRRWRWYADATSETPVTPLDIENSAPTDIVSDQVVKLRVTVKEQNDIGLSGAKFRLQFSNASDFLTNTAYVAEVALCDGASGWCYADGAGVDNILITTKTLSDADACSGSAGTGCGTHNESGVSTSSQGHAKSAAAEYEFTIKNSGAQTNTVYYFRLYDTVADAAVPLMGTSTYPSLLTEAGALSFTVQGLPSGTSTEGIVTDVSTTPTSIPFGLVPFGTDMEAGQRLTVTTNAAQGYALYIYGDSGFLGSTGGEIDPVTATNGGPAAWTSACVASSAGCYGYHAGDDVLGGGSTRFAANDTYAKFETDIREIAYNSVPTNNESTDMIYRLKVTASQLAGDYQDGITYILVPVY